MDRSTGRVVVPFSGCAAPSLHPCWWCRVVERSLAIEERRREQRRGQEREEETLGRRVHNQQSPVNQPPGSGVMQRSVETSQCYTVKRFKKYIRYS